MGTKRKVTEEVVEAVGNGGKKNAIVISPPKFQVLPLTLLGTAPYMQNRFSQKAMNQMMAKMAAGSTTRKDKTKTARDFDRDFEEAQHISSEGWVGVPASSIRSACIDVCRMVQFKMTHAKMSIFVEADGLDAVDGTPLVKLKAGKPERTEMPVRNATGVVDIRIRPMWRMWELPIRVRFDADQFTAQDVYNLINRAGIQVGIGEGRPFSKSSNGIGFGTFTIKS